MINILSNVPSFLPGIIALVVFLVIFFSLFALIGVLFKKRSTVSAIMLFLAIGSIFFFLLDLDVDGSPLSFQISSLGAEYGIGNGLYLVMEAFATPVRFTHSLLVSIIAGIAQVDPSDESMNFVSSGILAMIIYVILFIAAFILFNRKKKTKRVYSDYLS